MKGTLGLGVLAAMLAACLLACVTMLYAAGGLAASQTVRAIPFVGPSVSGQIRDWVLGAEVEHVADTAPYYPAGDPLPATSLPYPVTPVPVTPQPGDPDCGVPYLLPVAGRITSRFGWRPNLDGSGRLEFHAGVDISTPSGTLVAATMCGEVTQAGWSDLYGWVVGVTSGNITTLYGHNSELYVSVGQHVGRGQSIAASGNTGRSTGPHVHYGISVGGVWVDPLEAFGVG